MARRIEESDLLVHPASPRERQNSRTPLICRRFQRSQLLLHQFSCLPCNICVKSKAAVLILVWSVVVGAVYLGILSSFGVLGYSLQDKIKTPSVQFVIPVYTVVASYAFLAIILLLYPLSGYLADIHYGRYKAVIRSLFLIWIAMIFFSAAMVIAATHENKDFKHLKYSLPLILCGVVAVLLMIVSLACYQANIIQLGLDQLLEAPSEKLGLFLHWLMWSYTLGEFLMLLSIVFLPCYVESKTVKEKISHVFGAVSVTALVFVTLLLSFTCYNHSWFYSEPGQNNPYKTVLKVLHFARKNKYPLRRSAFTFCDEFIPSRIDFAKERYGGPFTTEQVENVKTFLRIVLVLLALGPVFVLEVPGSYYLFPLFALHIAEEVQFQRDQICHSVTKWVLLQSRSLGYIVSILFVPIYIWVVFSLLRKKIPKILKRLQCAFVISLSGVLSLLVIDLIGHFHYRHGHPSFLENGTENTCLFTSHFLYAHSSEKNPLPIVLHLHWGATIIPNILLNFGSLLVQATAFEFISAQSPHSMKGLLVGVFFAIKGLFQFISAAAVVPFAIPNIWNHINPVTNCGFGYYLFTIVVALIGLVVFSFVVRRYQYRQRDEQPFDQRFAEEYYARYIGSTNRPAAALHSPSDDLLYHDQQGITCSSEETSSVSDTEGYGATVDSKLAQKLPGNISSK